MLTLQTFRCVEPSTVFRPPCRAAAIDTDRWPLQSRAVIQIHWPINSLKALPLPSSAPASGNRPAAPGVPSGEITTVAKPCTGAIVAFMHPPCQRARIGLEAPDASLCPHPLKHAQQRQRLAVIALRRLQPIVRWYRATVFATLGVTISCTSKPPSSNCHRRLCTGAPGKWR